MSFITDLFCLNMMFDNDSEERQRLDNKEDILNEKEDYLNKLEENLNEKKEYLNGLHGVLKEKEVIDIHKHDPNQKLNVFESLLMTKLEHRNINYKKSLGCYAKVKVDGKDIIVICETYKWDTNKGLKHIDDLLDQCKDIQCFVFCEFTCEDDEYKLRYTTV